MAFLSPPPRTYDASTLTRLIHGKIVEEQQPKSYFSPPSSYRQTATAVSSSQKQRSTIHVHFDEPESSRGSRRITRTVEEFDDGNPFRSPFDDRHLSIASTASSSHSFIAEQKMPQPPHHVYSPRRKKCIVWIVSFAAMFSSLSSNIYFPALGQVAKDLNVTMAEASLTITVYMAVQGVAPSFWGPLSDTKGRRIAFIGTFIVYLFANIGLAFSRTFAVLMVFRGIQAAGSSATIAIGTGVICDITTKKERGGYMGTFGSIRMIGLTIGPVFGGIISQFLGWHAIFWFLFGFGSLALLLIILFLPETHRSIAGNGTIRLSSIHRPLIYSFSPPAEGLIDHDIPPRKKLTLYSFVAPLRFLFEKDIFLSLFFFGYIYAVWSMVTSSTTALFQVPFGLTQLQTGFAFLPNGLGCYLGPKIAGKFMDRDYNFIETRYRERHGISSDAPLNKKELDDFPIVESRLRNIWWMITTFILAMTVYGYSLLVREIVVPLILQFIISFMANAAFTVSSALAVDLYPGTSSASATAVVNLMRCSLGAVGVSVVQPIIDNIAAEPTFLIFAAFTVVLAPMLLLVWYYGEGWRVTRNHRLKAQEEAKKAMDAEGQEMGK